MQLSKKRKAFSQFFAAFLKLIFNFRYFAKKDDHYIAFAFPKLQTAEDVVRQMS